MFSLPIFLTNVTIRINPTTGRGLSFPERCDAVRAQVFGNIDDPLSPRKQVNERPWPAFVVGRILEELMT